MKVAAWRSCSTCQLIKDDGFEPLATRDRGHRA